MVAAQRAGATLQEVAKEFSATKSTVQRWVKFAEGKRLDRVDFHDKKSGPVKSKNKSSSKIEKRDLQLRKHLKEKSVLGLHGAEAIRDEMLRRGDVDVPTSRTVANILKRNGMVDARTRVRRPAPPPGWYLPGLLQRKHELDSFDIVEGLYLQGGQEVQFLNGISLHGNLLHSLAIKTVTTESTVLALIKHWKQFGLPKYVQFDNDMVFQGPRKENAIGKVIRLCLSLSVIPVFTTPYEQGFQGKIVYLRRTDRSGRIRFLEREFLVSAHWINRLVRAEVDLDECKVRFYGLRRADWKSQRLLKTLKFRLSKKTTSD